MWYRYRERQLFWRLWSPADFPPIRSALADFFRRSAGQRRAALQAVKISPRTQVFYEARHRIAEELADMVEVLGKDRHVVIARKVTNLHEEFLRGRAKF